MAVPTWGPVRPHVGRADELARTLAAVTEPEGRGAVLAGPAGVGKSHLLDRAVAHLAKAGWAPLRAQGDPARRQPFSAFGDLLPSLTGDPDRWALVLRTGVDHLLAEAGGAEPVLVADDLHAFDPASAALVQQAVADGRLHLVASLRTGEPAPDAVTALWKDELVERIDVPPLPPEDAAELAERLVGGPIDAATHARLWAWTDGNPLLVTEIVEQARQHEGWRLAAGLWRLDEVPARSLRLSGLLAERVARGPAEVADLVDAVALAGRLPMAVADALVGRDTVARAERLRLVRVRPEHGRAGITLDHPLYGELRRSATSVERQAALRHRLLDVVEGLDDELGAADLALVAQWYLETGRSGPRTPAILLAAAERAWGGNDPERAAALARRAWELRPDDGAGHLLVSALARVGNTTELEVIAPIVVATASTDRVRAQAVLTHALAQFQFTNRPELGLAILEDGARHVTDPDWRDVLSAEVASYTLQAGDIAAAEAIAVPLLASSNPRVAADAAAVVGPVRALQGRIAEAIATADRGIELIESLTDDYLDTGQYLFHKLVALVDDGQVTLAEELALAAVAQLPPDVDPFTRAFVALSLGRILRLRGRPVSAARWFREAAAAFEAVRRFGFAAWSFAGLAAVLAEAGDLEGAEAAATRAVVRDHPIRVGGAEVQRSLAWLHVARGDLGAAAAAFDAAAERGLAAGELVHAGHALHDLVRVGRAAQACDRLADLATRTDSAVLAVYAAHARAAAASDRGGLAAVAERYEDLGCDMAAAEAWSEAARTRPSPSSAASPSAPGSPQVVWGRSAPADPSPSSPPPGGAQPGAGADVARPDAAGERPSDDDIGRVDRDVAAARRRAATLAARCEGARSPLLGEAGPAGRLSARELEVARLAAAGEHRRAIAERLVISPRTVDSHLQRVYRKMGVSSSAALADALAESGDI